MSLYTLIDRIAVLRVEQGDIDYSTVVHDDLDDENMLRLWLQATQLQTDVNVLVRALEAEAVRRLDGKSKEVDGFVVYPKKGYTKEECVDPDGFLDWLSQHPEQVGRVLNPNQVKKGSLPAAVRSTFFEKTEVVKPDAKPQAVPVEVLEQNRQRKAAQA